MIDFLERFCMWRHGKIRKKIQQAKQQIGKYEEMAMKWYRLAKRLRVD